MELTKEENQVISKFLKNLRDEGCQGLFRLTQFIIMRWSEEAIDINAGELSMSQTMEYKGKRYTTRMAIQYSVAGEKTLEERAGEIADRMVANGSENCDIREELKKAVLAGYNLYREDFD